MVKIKEAQSFADELCYHKYVYFFMFVGYLAVNVAAMSLYNIKSIKSWIVALSLLVIYLGLLFIVISKRSLPKFKSDEYGIIFSVDMEDEKQFSLIRDKFVKEFQYKLKNEGKNYRIVVLTQFVSNKMKEKYIDKKDYDGLCKKTKCKFVIYGRSVKGGEKEDISCKLHLDSVIFHNPMPSVNHKVLQREMSITFKPIRDIEIYKTTETKDFEKHAMQLNLAFDYILATTHLFLSEFSDACQVFGEINRILRECDDTAPMIKMLKNVIGNRLYWCYIFMANREVLSYYDDNEYQHMRNAKKLLDLACFYEKNGYDYKLLIAIYYFFEGNIKTALSHIEECKNITNDKGWKFSRVFLKLYQQDSFTNFMNAYKTYNSIFVKPAYTFEYITNISEFIHRVLEKEPQKKQLNFLLFLIYHYLENTEEEERYYNAFINAYPELIDNENFVEILIKLGKVVKKECPVS